MARGFWNRRNAPAPKALHGQQYGSPLGRSLTSDGEVARRERISFEDRYEIFLQNPLYRKGVVKHSGDLVKEWFCIVDQDGEKVPDAERDFQAWAREAGIKKKIRDALIQAHVFDNGILELVYDDDAKPHEEVAPDAVLVDINPLPRKTTTLTLHRTTEGAYVFGAKHRPFGNDVIKFHPDRIHALEVHPNPEEAGGVSTAEAAYHAALSHLQGQKSYGDIIRHHGPGFKHAKVLDDDAATIKTLANIFAGKRGDGTGKDLMLRGLATGANVEITNYDASGLDVSSFEDAMTIGIAAALGMPVDTLKGVQAGAVTGSETNRTDYQDAIRESRAMNVDPLATRLIMGRFGADAPLAHEWQDFPSNPLDEARIFRERAASVESLWRAGVPLHVALREAGIDIAEDELEPGVVDEVGLLRP